MAAMALLVGAAGSLAFTFRAGQRSPRLLLVVFVIWVLSPFVALLVADRAAPRWPVPMRRTIAPLAVLVAVGSLVAYARDAFGPPHPQAAFVFVMVPFVSWVAITLTLAGATLAFRRRSR